MNTIAIINLDNSSVPSILKKVTNSNHDVIEFTFEFNDTDSLITGHYLQSYFFYGKKEVDHVIDNNFYGKEEGKKALRLYHNLNNSFFAYSS